MRAVLKQYVLIFLALSCSREGGNTAAKGQPDSASAQASSAPSPSAGSVGEVVTTARRTLLFIGTSLTAGYGLEPDSAFPQQIQHMIDAADLPYTVVNAGVSGETSSALLRRLDWLLRQPFDVVVIETGANDGLRGIPVATMRQNIETIIERIRAGRPNARIVLVQMEAPPNLGAAYTREFRETFPQVARAKRVELLPFLLQDVAGRRELNQADGIHPNYEGERIVAQNVWKALRPVLQ